MKIALEKQDWHVEWLDEMHGWILTEKGNYLAEIVTHDDSGNYIPSVKRREAFAQLMASAPKLLKALKRLRSDPHAWQQADEAIADAERGLSLPETGNGIEPCRVCGGVEANDVGECAACARKAQPFSFHLQDAQHELTQRDRQVGDVISYAADTIAKLRVAGDELHATLKAVADWASDAGPLAGKAPMDVAEAARVAAEKATVRA